MPNVEDMREQSEYLRLATELIPILKHRYRKQIFLRAFATTGWDATKMRHELVRGYLLLPDKIRMHVHNEIAQNAHLEPLSDTEKEAQRQDRYYAAFGIIG